MKKIISTLVTVAALALFAVSASAQSYNLQTTSLNGGTNNVSASTTNSSFTVVIPATKSTYVSLQPSFKLTSTGTSAVVFKFDRSVDGSIWEPTASSVSVTAAGTSVVTAVGSVTMGGTGYLRLSTVENPNANAITNLTLKYSVKTGL